MKITSQSKHLLLADVKSALEARGWNLSKLAVECGIHQSQVSRIVAGKFRTFGSNVMKICIILGMEPAAYYVRYRADEDRRLISNSALAIWNGTHADTAIVVSLLQEIAKLRGARRKV